MRAVALVAVLLLAVLAVASAETFYKEQFDSQSTQQTASSDRDREPSASRR